MISLQRQRALEWRIITGRYRLVRNTTGSFGEEEKAIFTRVGEKTWDIIGMIIRNNIVTEVREPLWL